MHTCIICHKNFNSKEQWRAHNAGKKHKRNYEIALKGRVEEQDSSFFANNYSIHEDIQKLRAQGISIPRMVNKIIKCHKINSQGYEMNTSKMIELSESCILMEEQDILGIYVDSFFPSTKCLEYYDLLEFIYEHGGVVERGQEKSEGDMVMCGWRLDTFTDNIAL